MTELIPTTTGEDRRNALIRAVGFDKLNEPQRELALAIANNYGLDPMLKHIVMIDGRAYITRDGLLHVAHRSGDFDGIEVSDPVLDPEPDPKGVRYWRCRASVYRRSFARPFVYPGRYPAAGGNVRYAEEMAIKVAECMSLRRAFDVSAPTLEERWDHDDVDLPDGQPEPTSLAERVALRAGQIEHGHEPAEPTETVEVVDADGTVDEPVDPPYVSPLRDEEPTFIAPPEGFPTPAPVRAEPVDPLVSFSEWAAGRDMALIRGVTKELYPDAAKFGDLTPEQLTSIIVRVEVVESQNEAAAAAYDDAVPDAPEPTETPATPAVDPDVPDADEAAQDGPYPKPVLCADVSPLSGATCTMDKGHKGVHRAGLKEAW